MKGDIFDRCIETRSAPIYRAGDVVILNNLARHESPRSTRSLRETGAQFLFLPPCGPDPIERRSRSSRRGLERPQPEPAMRSDRQSVAYAIRSSTKHATTDPGQQPMNLIERDMFWSVW